MCCLLADAFRDGRRLAGSLCDKTPAGAPCAAEACLQGQGCRCRAYIGPGRRADRGCPLPQLHGVQTLFHPDDCFMAEDIAKKDPEVQRKLRDDYGITDLSLVACDPWSGAPRLPRMSAPRPGAAAQARARLCLRRATQQVSCLTHAFERWHPGPAGKPR